MHCIADGLLEELHSLVQEELKVVSYKWLARQYQIPSNHAKQVLRQYLQQHGSQAKAIFLVAGQLQADPNCLVTRLVDSAHLTACLEDFAGQPSVHVHSVMPAEPRPVTDPGRLWAEDVLQARHFYQSVLQQQADGSSADVFARNACSSVKFEVSIATPQGKQQQQQQQQQCSPPPAAGGHAVAGSPAESDAEEPAAAAAGDDAGGPPAKRQKVAAAAAAAGGSFRIDPETGEEVWEEDQPRQPAAAAADGAAVAAAAAAQRANEAQLNRAAPAAAAAAVGGAGAKGSATIGAGKAAAAGSKAGGSKPGGKGSRGGKGGGAGQRNITSFFGKH
uniref:DNA polymerase delta subunit 3 n=1 Tax=Tetradesmus obliquus TaxID=3088 RepID=A0A383WDL1_TETOB|eukprot:jgi/Sobl393_1/7079/SZX75695.1